MTDRINGGGRGRILAIAAVTLIALGLAWVFYGSMDDKEGRIKVALAMAGAREAQSAAEAYYAERQALPPDNNALRLPNRESKPYFTAFEQKAELSFGIVVQGGALTVTFAPGQDPVSGKTLVFVPKIAGGGLEWTCNTGTVDARYLPAQCRGH